MVDIRQKAVTKVKTDTQLAMRVDQIIVILAVSIVATSFFAAALILSSFKSFCVFYYSFRPFLD